MKAKDLKDKTAVELRQEIKDLLRAQFSLRMQLSTQQTNKTHELRNTRRDIARVRTVMHQMKLAASK